MKRAVATCATLIGLVLSGCGGDDDKPRTTPAVGDGPDTATTEAAPPPSTPSQLPPEFIKCMADQGYDVQSSADVHSAPPQVLQACFGSIHGGGGAP